MSKNTFRISPVKIFRTVSSKIYSEQLAELCRARCGFQMCVELMYKAHSSTCANTSKNVVVSQSQKHMVLTFMSYREMYFKWSSL